ncbi:MAG: adenine deaminase [Promethearchaeota archaeon]
MKRILKNARLIDVEELSIKLRHIIIDNGEIIDILPITEQIPENDDIIDLKEQYVSPGFIDSHLHIESSMMPPLEFAKYSTKHGTTCALVDPHEIANVSGKDGINLWIEQAKLTPMDIYIGIPSCVPATHLEHSGAEINVNDIKDFLKQSNKNNDQIYGLGEMMNFPGIIHGFGDAREKVDAAISAGKIVDGHCPGVSGSDLMSYITNGKNDGIVRISSDHESTNASEVIEKINGGMTISLRYGSATRDLDRILPDLIEADIDFQHIMLCSDDLSPSELYTRGHVDRIIKQARDIFLEKTRMSLEQTTCKAISLATLNPGKYIEPFLKSTNRLPIGKISKGYKANLVVFKTLESIDISYVISNGKIVVKDDSLQNEIPSYDYSNFHNSVNISHKITNDDFVIPYNGNNPSVQTNVIQTTPISLITKHIQIEMPIIEINGQKQIISNPEEDILKIAVFDRHHSTGSHSVGLIKGIGIKKGAIASTVAHDNHNLIIVGTDDESMSKIANIMKERGGGMASLTNDSLTFFPLPIAGLMSSDPIEKIVDKYNNVKKSARDMGSSLENVFMTMSFMALAVIPEIKITDMGIVDVNSFKIIPLFDEEN